MNQIKEIIEKTKELLQLIQNSTIYEDYQESLQQMKNDYEAQQVFTSLVQLGEDLNIKSHKGEPLDLERNAEYEQMKQQFESNKLVKKHLIAQKEYLDLLQQVLDKIRNPE